LRRPGKVLTVIAAVCVLWAVAATSSEAAYHPFITSFGSFSSPQSVATDSADHVYVLDQGAGSVQKFDSAGNPVEFSSLGSNTLTGAATPAGSFSFSNDFGQLAVDRSAGPAAGDLYVADSAHHVVDVFSSTSGEYLGQLTQANGSELNEVCGVAVGAAGQLYVADYFAGVDRYIPAANPPVNANFDAQIGGFGHCQIAADTSGDIYANDFSALYEYPASQFGGFGNGTKIDSTSNAVAVDPSTQDVYAAEPKTIAQFDGAGNPLGTFAAAQVKDPRGLAVDGSGKVFIANAGSGNVAVYGPTPPAVAPQILTQSSVPTYAEAELRATINPGNEAATYRFEYGPTESYGQSTAERTIAANGVGVDVGIPVLGLSPGTTYHFRVVAENSVEQVSGSDQTLTTLTHGANGPCPNDELRIGPSALLPECRAYEMVSPVDKSGANVNMLINVQGALGGDAAVFASTTAFAGNAANPLGDRYLSRRGPNGWSTEGIDPTQFNKTDILAQVSDAAPSELGETLQASKVALAPGAVEGGSNVYLRDNSTGARTTIASESDNRMFQEFKFNGTSSAYRDSTADFSHIVLESTAPLAPGASDGTENVFDYTGGHFVLVSRLPVGGELPSGSHAGYSEHPSYPQHIISTDGRRIFFMGGTFGSGPLYLWETGVGTVPISVSQRSGDGAEPAAAEFAGANSDGSIVYFVSSENLTEASETHFRPTLYRYDVEAGHLTDITAGSPSSEGAFLSRVVGISEDGSYVYFEAAGALAEGAQEADFLSPNLYVWHEGETRFIAQTVNEFPSQRYTSANGRYLAFTAFTPLTSSDVHSPNCPANPEVANPDELCRQVYVYDYDAGSAGELTCVSCSGPGAGHSELGGYDASFSNLPGRSVLDDGTVFFNTPNKLAFRDTNAVEDVYAWREGKATLVSSGVSDQPSNFADATPDGGNVFFRTSQQLVGLDVDQSVDLYDARLDGGIAAQNPPPPMPPCEGEACKNSAPAQPGSAGFSTATQSGPGNGRVAACRRLSADAGRAKRRVGQLNGQARRASGKTAHRLRQRAERQSRKAERLTAKARNCGGQR
jgi:hypothetical protein